MKKVKMAWLLVNIYCIKFLKQDFYAIFPRRFSLQMCSFLLYNFKHKLSLRPLLEREK